MTSDHAASGRVGSYASDPGSGSSSGTSGADSHVSSGVASDAPPVGQLGWAAAEAFVVSCSAQAGGVEKAEFDDAVAGIGAAGWIARRGGQEVRWVMRGTLDAEALSLCSVVGVGGCDITARWDGDSVVATLAARSSMSTVRAWPLTASQMDLVETVETVDGQLPAGATRWAA